MNYQIFFFLLVQSVYCQSQQAITLNLETKVWDSQRKKFYIQKIWPEKFISLTDSSYILQNLDTVSRYALYRLTFQSKTDINKGCYLSILIGPNNHEQIIMVIDKNNNENFSDDGVYTVDMKKPVTSYNDFYCRAPTILIDSLIVYNKQNKEEYKSIKLKLGVSKTTDDYFENFEQLKVANSFILDVYVMEYYSSKLQQGNDKYEFAVALNPLTQRFSDYPGTVQGGSVIILYKALDTRDSVISFLPLFQPNPSNSGLKNAFALGNDIFKINKLSVSEKKLMLTKSFHTDFKELNSIVEKRHDGLSGLLSDSAYTLLDFSGSWCKPCQTILPKLQMLYKTYNSKVAFVTVAVENDPETAQRYHAKTGNEWRMVYENLNCSDEQCLKKKLNVNGFPTLILIDRNKQIVFQNTGTQAIDELEQLFQKLFESKGS
jgi:thiol-disulfide isomerase/thioredoxin